MNMIVSSMEVMMTAPMERFVQDMATAQRASAGTMSDIEKSVDQLKASISSISSAEQSRASIFARGFTDSKRLLAETKVVADSTAKSLEELKIDPDALKLPPAAFADLKTWQEKSAYAIGAGVGAGVVTAQAALEKFEDYVKAKAIITAAAIATGVAAAVFTGIYAAYKATDFAIGLLTGESYKSANIDALIALNKPLGALKKEFKLTTAEASALSATLNSLGTSADDYIGSFNAASLAVKNNSAQMDALGIAYKDAAGNALPMKDVLANTSKVLDQYSSGWERNSVAVMLGFSSSAQVNTGLEVTAEKLAEVSARQAEYGLLISQDQRDEISRYKTTMGEFNEELENTSQGLKVAIADNIMPILTDLADFFKEGWPTAVMAFRYSMATVTSLFYGLKTVFDIVVEAIVASVKAVSAVFGGMVGAIFALIKGDWSGAMSAFVGGFSTAADRMSKIGENIVQYAKNNAKAMALAWGNAAVDAAKSLLGIESASASKAAVAPKATEKTAADAAATTASVEAYKAFTKAIDEKIAAQKLEIQVGDKLTEGQRQALAFSMQLADGTLKISDAEKIARAEKLESLVALEKTNLKEQENRKKAEDAANKSAAASKKEVEAYASLMVSIGEKIAANKLEISGYDKLTDSQKMSIKLDEEIKRSKNKLEPAHIKEARDLIAIVAAQEEVIKAAKLAGDAAVARADARRSEQAGIDAYFESQTAGYAAAVKGSRDALKSAQDEYAQFGKSKSQIAEITLLTLQSAQAKLTDGSEGYIAAQKQIEAQQELIGILKKTEVREEYKAIFDSIDQTAHDTFVSMFDSGKSAFDRLRDTLKSGLLDLLYQMTIKKWILNIGTSVSNTGVAGIAGAAQAVTGGTATGAIGAAQSAGSLYNAVSGAGMAGMLSTAGSGIAALGTTFGSSAVSAFGAGFAAEAGAGIMTAAETFGAAGMAAEASAASLGAAFSAAIPWIGAAVAAVGVWNAFFEDGPEKNTRLNFTSNNAAGAISINERGNEGKNSAYIGDTGKSSFGTFGVSSTFWMEAAQPVVESFIKSVSQTDDALAAFLTSAEKASVTSYLTGKTSIAHTGAEGTNPNEKGQLDDVFTDRINNILAGVEPGLESLVKDFDGTSQALATEAAALLQYRAALKDSGEALFGQVVTMQQIAALKAPTETSAEALKRVGVEFTATNQVAAILGKTSSEAFGSAGLASETARRQLVLFAGGADALASSTVAYSQNFMSDAERLAPVTKALGAAMDSLGLAGVTTKDQFKAAVQGLVNSGALATEEGAKQYAGLMAIQSTFTQVADAQAAQVAARRAIEIQIMEAQGNAIGATAARRQDELTALAKTSPELVGLQKSLYAVQDAATAAAETSTILGLQAQMYQAMGDKAGEAAVLELQHTAALVGMSPALADASIKLWDAQKAEKARNTELATTNSILGYQQQIAEATGDKLGAATASQELFNLTLKDMTPEVAGWATKARNAQLAQKTSNDALEDSNQLLGFESTMYTAKKDKVNLAITAEKQFQNSLVGLSPVLVKAATDAHTAVLAEKALSDARVENNGILSLQERYYAATGDAAGALKVKLAQQKDALIGLSPEMASWTQKTWDAEDVAKVAKTNRGLEIEIMELTGNKIGALVEKRKDEAKGVDASTKALLDARNAAQDVEAAAKVNEAREKIEVQMLELQGKKVEALAVSRRSEFWGLDSTLVPMMQRLHVLQDEATAATEAAAVLDLLGQRYEAQGNAAGLAGVKLQQQTAALAQMTPALAAATKATWDAQAAQKVAETRRGIEIQIMEAQGKTAEALAATREDEIKALEMTAPALVGLKKSLYGLQDAAALTEKRHALDIQLLEATGKSAAALAVKRFDELGAMDASLRATQLLIYAAEDAATALDKAKTATDAALAAVQKAVEVEKTRITVIRDAAAESVTSIKSVFDLLKTQVDQLYATVGSTAAMQAAQGSQFIDEALLAAQTGGKLPDQQQLADAIAAARGGLDATQFATQFEADRAALVMAGKLAQIQSTSGHQLSAAEQALAVANDQLTALDAQLTLAQQQVDTLNGINASVTGLPESLAALAAAIAAQKAAVAPAPQTYASAPTALTSMPTQTGGSYATTRMGEADLVRLSGGVSFLANDTWSQEQTASYVSGLMSTYSANAQALASLTAYGKDEHLPGFAVGINYVPQDMTARIHEGEAIVPASFNPFNPSARQFGNSGNEELIAEIRELRVEVGRLRGDVGTGNNSLRRIDSATNGNPDQPVPVAILEDETA